MTATTSMLDNLTRYPERASEDLARLHALLDEVMVATLCGVVDGLPWAVPIFFARDEDRLLFHGSTGAGLLRHLSAGQDVAVTVYAVDAIVVAQSAFDSSANYRSAVLRGAVATVPSGEHERALRTLTDRLIPGRTAEVRASTRKELAATTVLALDINDGSWIYKSRTGAAGQSEPAGVDAWAGIVPVKLTAQQPIADPWVADDVAVPDSVLAVAARYS